MTYQEMLQNRASLRDQIAAIPQKAVNEGRGMTDAEKTQFADLQGQEKGLTETINAFEASQAALKDLSGGYKPAAEPKNHEPLRVFKNLGEQLYAIKNAAVTGIVDERLNRINAAALGGNEGIGSEGGFAVQTDIAGAMMETAAKAGEILSRVDKYQVSGPANSVKWMDIDETDVGTTVFGGVQVYWAAEAAQVSASKPKTLERELKLEKLIGLAYATYELEKDDSGFTSQLYQRAFELGIQRALEAGVIAGTGAGQLQGILGGGALVSVAKETGQAADTILYNNIVKMYNRGLNKSDPGWAWLVNPDLHEQLDFMQFPVGTGGVPVYLQASSAGTLDQMKGKPIIESDQCSAIGDKGDIFFADLSKYLLIYKGGIDSATSIHVQFLTAENCFRFIFRANGMPKKRSSVTLKNTSNARSSFVTLDAR